MADELDQETRQLMVQRDEQLATAKDWHDLFKRNNDGGVRVRSIYNARLIMENDTLLADVLAYDEFSEQLIKTRAIPDLGIAKGYWSDNDEAILRSYLDERYNLLFARDTVADAVVAVANKRVFNPVKKRVESVKWDGQPRAARYFIDYLGAEDNAYTQSITKIWLTGLIGRIYQPGIKFEIVPILEGKQGIGKSTAPRNLYPEKFNDSLSNMGKNKDDYQQLLGSWIIEVAELSAMKKTDIEGIKSFISARSDTYRNSYGHYATPHPRKCVFIGTTNQQDYLKDATGERRFYPIKCGVNQPRKDVQHPQEQDILQVLAEAKFWFESGEDLYPDTDTLNVAQRYQSEASVVDLTKETVEDFLNMAVPANWDELTLSTKQSYFTHRNDADGQPAWINAKIRGDTAPLSHTTTREIMAVVFHKTPDKFLSGKTNSEAKRIKLIMDNMVGWEKNNNLVLNGSRVRGYVRNTHI